MEQALPSPVQHDHEREQGHTGHREQPVPTLATLPVELTDRLHQFIAAATAENTRAALRSDWSAFTNWCRGRYVEPLPAHPETVAAYLADHAAVHTPATLRRRMATISKAHQVANLPNPTRAQVVTDTMRGIARTTGTGQRHAPPLVAVELQQVLEATEQDTTAAGIRDTALLLLGWCGAFRRSELASLTWGDIAAVEGGYSVTVRHAKTDRRGTGQQVAVPSQAGRWCPVVAVAAWKAQVRTYGGAEMVANDQPVFRRINRHQQLLAEGLSGQAVAAVVHRRCAAAGIEGMQGHSLRVGLIWSATQAGVSDSALMQTTRHAGLPTLRRYQREASAMSRAASRGLL